MAYARSAHHGYAVRALPFQKLGERARGEEALHRRIQLGPQVMGHAALALAAVLAPAALRRVEALLHREEDVGDTDPGGVACEAVAAARPAHARHQFAAAQLAEQLLQVAKRDLLPLADAGERHRAGARVKRQVQHRGDGKAALGGEFQGAIPSDSVKYTEI